MRDEAASRKLVVELVRRVAIEKEVLAEELGVSYASLYAWSTGRRRPGRRVLQRMAELAERRSEELESLAEQLREAGGEQRLGSPGAHAGNRGQRGARAFDGFGGRR